MPDGGAAAKQEDRAGFRARQGGPRGGKSPSQAAGTGWGRKGHEIMEVLTPGRAEPTAHAIHEPGQGQARDGHAARGRGLGLPSERKPPRGFRFPPLTHTYPLWPKPWAQ